jgi:oligopeptide/dipeptide ABC transporter ATP-binding protein
MSPVLDIEDLHVSVGTSHGLVEPVRGVSLSVEPGEAMALVGESGSGKTVTALAVMRLLPTDRVRIEARRFELCGKDIRSATSAEMREIRGNRAAMVFQDPMSSLNPVMRLGGQVAEAVRRTGVTRRAEVKQRVHELLASVEVDPERVARSYPHQLSGGMKQRVMIAIALACEPALIIADEPTTALDVSTQAGVLDLLESLSRNTGTALLLITHDLGVVARVASRVAVMYAGHIVETGATADVLKIPRHPYTRGLLDSVPRMSDERGAEFPAIPGSAPDVRAIPPGCAFAPRCARRTADCVLRPELARLSEVGVEGDLLVNDHQTACWHPLEMSS